MIEKVITDNAGEKITVKYDGTRFALVLFRKSNDVGATTSVIAFNPEEAMILLKFLGSMGKEE